MPAQRKTDTAEIIEIRSEKRKNVSQKDVPAIPLQQALRVPRAIVENYAGRPTKPLKVAEAMGMQPNNGNFRQLCGAAVAYGMIEGGAYADQISVTPLARRVFKPIKEGDDALALREAFLTPRVINEFLTMYNDAQLPKENIAINVLEGMGVPADRARTVLELILLGAEEYKLIRELKQKKYVDLEVSESRLVVEDTPEETPDSGTANQFLGNLQPIKPPVRRQTTENDSRKRRVFITHGKNKAFIEPIKKLLKYGELEAVVAIEHNSVSQPIPDKVMNDMRNCGAAIIHVDAEMRVNDENGNEHIILNPNVLIEIGAAMALYGRRFILLVKDGTQLPSNLQGLAEVRYTGDNLDVNVTIQLLESINDIKNHPLPEEVPTAAPA